MTTLTAIDFSGNKIGDVGAEALAEVLKTNTTITSINLSDNNIGPRGGPALAEVLKTNTTITSINLSRNDIGPADAKAINNILDRNKQLLQQDCTKILDGQDIESERLYWIISNLKNKDLCKELNIDARAVQKIISFKEIDPVSKELNMPLEISNLVADYVAGDFRKSFAIEGSKSKIDYSSSSSSSSSTSLSSSTSSSTNHNNQSSGIEKKTSIDSSELLKYAPGSPSQVSKVTDSKNEEAKGRS